MNEAQASAEAPQRRIWLFGANLTHDALQALLHPELAPAQRSAFHPDFVPDEEEYRDPLCDLMGAAWLDHDFVEVIDPTRLGDLGLAGYLVQTVGIDQAQVSAVRDVLTALRGPVIIVFEDAFGGNPTAMHPDPRLVYLGTYTNQPTPIEFRAAPLVPPAPRAKGYGALVAPVLILAILALVYLGG